ncbi:cytochrome P450 1A1-like [Ruditapes philippinarum]|uniref:cytochrome P450 1A1-like n=1 Tax=Ruditapes philippinarum TaxID=129788 RepID=UPI00295AC855|nr:cytochrome P450 1A1-like [Ruditapes philippinarum]
MSELTVILEIISFVFLTCLMIKRIFQNRNKTYPDGPFGFPIIGHLPLFGNYPPKTFMKWWNSYGDVFSIRLGSWNTVVVNGYDAVKAAAEHPDDVFSGRPNFFSMDIYRKSVKEVTFAFSNFSPVYLKQKQLTSKALRSFTYKRPEIIEDLVTNEANAFADIIVKKYNRKFGPIELDVQTFATRIVYQFLYGRSKTVDIKTIIKSLEEVNELVGSGSLLNALPWLRFVMPRKIDKFVKCLVRSYDIAKKQIREHNETFTVGNVRDVADAIIATDVDADESRDKNVLTRQRLNLTLGDLQEAGVDTTNKTLSWLFLFMAEFPEIQERVFMEIRNIVGTERNVLLKDKPDLVYTNAVILEVMRIVTPVPFMLPHFSMKNAKLQGFDVDKDTVVIFNIYSVHHEEKFWGDPKNFRPERFLSDGKNLDQEKCNHVFAFGLGRRRCIGEEFAKMTLFLSFTTAIQKCKIIKPAGENLDLTPVPGLVYSPRPYNVLVQERY